MWKNLCVAAVAAGVMGVVGASCSGSTNICVERNIRCTAPLTCDSGDGVCKCGGRGGIVCGEGQVCDPVANTCVSNRCNNVDCSAKPGTSCDVLTGECKCGGTGGSVCEAGTECNPNAKACVPISNCNEVACPLNQQCDAPTGRCLCGTASCAPGESCSVDGTNNKLCKADNCTGVACTGSTSCDPADGICKCNGVVCQSGQACSCPASADGGCMADARVCRVSSLCSGVTCGNGTTCDPSDGQCKCGGPGGPVCASNQICNLGPPPQCEGGQQCSQPDGGAKVCPGGTSCDPEDGQCKCGGRGGTLCAPASTDDGGVVSPAEICISNPVQQVCRRPCDTRNPECGAGSYCYFDSSAATPAAYCAVPSGMQAAETGCTTPTSCFTTVNNLSSPLHCLNLSLGQTGICKAYCDVAAGMAGCLQDVARSCDQIPGAPAGVGYCRAN